jgi:predicted TIM-barrel fold metal-dependent hydrolase
MAAGETVGADRAHPFRAIDVRCRVTIPEAGAYFSDRARARGRIDSIKAFASPTIEAFFEEINSVGITTAVSVSGQTPETTIGGRVMIARTTPNELMAKLQTEHWGRFIGVGGIDAGNVIHDAIAEIDSCVALGLRAIFIEPGRSPGCDLSDRRLYPIYEKCVERGLVIIPQTSGPWGGKELECVHPRHLDRVAEDFQALQIIAGHACYPYVREAIIVAARHPNVFLAPDMYLLQMGTEDWVKSLNENYFGLRDQFLFGASFPSIPIKPFMDGFHALPLKKEVLPKILYRNAMRVFKLENDPTYQAMYRD